jgi:hypothetical protein
MKRNSPGLMIGGIVLTSAGAVVLSIGAVLAGAENQSDCVCDELGCDCGSSDEEQTTGIVLIVSGLVGVGVGIPMIVIGAKKVPDVSEPQAAVLLGPGSAKLRVQF